MHAAQPKAARLRSPARLPGLANADCNECGCTTPLDGEGNGIGDEAERPEGLKESHSPKPLSH